MPEPEQGDAICIHCGAEVFWGLPLPEDPCFECGKPVAEQGDVEAFECCLDHEKHTWKCARENLLAALERAERERDACRNNPLIRRWREYHRRAEKAERALAEIEVSEPDWAKGVDENCETLRSIARAALRPSEDTSDES